MKTDDFEWDDVKAEINRRAHKVTFEQACDALSDPFMVDWIDDGQDEGEDRFCALGMVENRLFFARPPKNFCLKGSELFGSFDFPDEIGPIWSKIGPSRDFA